MGFSIWNEQNVVLDWKATLGYFNFIGITSVPVLYDGIFNEAHLKKLWKTLDTTQKEGYVIRDAGEIAYDDFQQKVCKFVRKNHVTTNQHWKNGPCIPNLRHTNER